MPKHEKLRNARGREFQRVLRQTIGTPKTPNRFWIFVNSAIFIWFLSASVLTVGGGYISNHQQCVRDADQIIDRRAHLASEILARRTALAVKVADATKFQPPFAPGMQGSLYSDLSTVRFWELQSEFLVLIKRVEVEELPDPEIMKARLRWLDYDSSRADRDFDKGTFGAPSRPDEALKELKSSVEFQELIDNFERDLDITYSYGPDCTFLKTLGTTLGYKPQIVRASVSPWFLRPNFRRRLKDDMDAIDARTSQN